MKILKVIAATVIASALFWGVVYGWCRALSLYGEFILDMLFGAIVVGITIGIFVGCYELISGTEKKDKE